MTLPLAECFSCRGDPRKNGDRLFFTDFEYPTTNLSHSEFRALLYDMRPADLPTTSLTTHAKLYVFGQMYLIDALQEQCLHKLHRDLSVTEVYPRLSPALIDLIRFTYANTAGDGSTREGTGSELRYLVSAYVFCVECELIRSHEYRMLLADGESSEFQRDLTFHRYHKNPGQPGQPGKPKPQLDTGNADL